MQIGRQLLGSLITERVAHHEYLNIQKQIVHSQEVDWFLWEKFTNDELYAWMQGEISRLYYEYYRFAFDTARKAEQNMKRELMRPEMDATDYIKFNYWDASRKGLLSGEALYLDVKRMEMAYHENNKLEYELTKHRSLHQLDPVALLALKATGTCGVTVSEWLFDLDTPGHYMRRIKSVSLSIPAVTGFYTGIHCTLSLLKSSLRRSPQLKDDEYARIQDSEDDLEALMLMVSDPEELEDRTEYRVLLTVAQWWNREGPRAHAQVEKRGHSVFSRRVRLREVFRRASRRGYPSTNSRSAEPDRAGKTTWRMDGGQVFDPRVA